MQSTKVFLNKYQYDISIFLYLAFQLFLIRPEMGQMNAWLTTPYTLDYSFGIASRLLIGSFVNLLSPFLSKVFLYRFITIITLFFCLFLALFFGSCLRGNFAKQDIKHIGLSPLTGNINNALLALIALYFASPASAVYLFCVTNYGRMDLYLFIFSILSLFFIRHEKLKFLVPVLCLLAMATHQVFLFTYFPLIIGALMYHVYENRFNKRSILFSSVILFVTVISFIFFQFFAKMKFETVDEVRLAIRGTTDINIWMRMIEFEYFSTISDHRVHFISIDSAFRGLITFCLMLPMHLVLIYIFRQAKKYCKDKALKVIFAICMCLPVCAIPIFVVANDWGRWFAALYTVQVLLICYLSKARCEPMVVTLKKLPQTIQKHLFGAVMLILYLAALGKFTYLEIDATNKIADKLISMFG